MARASFQTITSNWCSAWRIPSRSVTASKVPPAMERTRTASGSRLPNPSSSRPEGLCVATAQAGSATGRARAPRPAKALMSSRACQSTPATTSAMEAVGAGDRRVLGERDIEHARVHLPLAKGLAAVERRDRDLRRAEQHPVDGIEIALGALENLRKRSAIVARAFARQLI